MPSSRTQPWLRALFPASLIVTAAIVAACSSGSQTATPPTLPASLFRSTAFSATVIGASGCTPSPRDIGVAPATLALIAGETSDVVACTKSGGAFSVSVSPAGIVSVPAAFRPTKSLDPSVHSASIAVTALAAGTATITISQKNGASSNVKVTVAAPPPTPTPTPSPTPTPAPVMLYVSNANGSIATDQTGSTAQTLVSANFGLGGIARDSAGDIFTTAPNNNIVFEYSSSGAGIATIYGFNTLLNAPHGVAIDPSGNIYVANTGSNSITIFASGSNNNAIPSGTISGVSTALNGPACLAFDASGDLYVTNSSGGSIVEFAPGANGNAAPIRTITGTSGPSQPWGIGFDSAGNMYVNDRGTSSIYKFAPGAGVDATPTAVISGTALAGSYGIAVTANGTVFAAQGDNAPGSIVEYAPGANGNATPAAVITGSALGDPVGVSI